MATQSLRPPNDTALIPPLRFAIVEKNVYRGSYPRLLNLPFLETLNLRTVLSITPEPLINSVAEWFRANGVQLIHISPDKSGKKGVPLRDADAKRAIEIIINEVNSPIYVHCLNGSEATGLTIGCLRKLQFWATTSIFSELQRFSEMHNSFEAFLDGFTIEEICIPVETPPWLWQGMKDEDGVIGPHRFRIKYLDSNLERKRTQRLVVEAQEHQNGTNHTGMFTDGSVNGY